MLTLIRAGDYHNLELTVGDALLRRSEVNYSDPGVVSFSANFRILRVFIRVRCRIV